MDEYFEDIKNEIIEYIPLNIKMQLFTLESSIYKSALYKEYYDLLEIYLITILNNYNIDYNEFFEYIAYFKNLKDNISLYDVKKVKIFSRNLEQYSENIFKYLKDGLFSFLGFSCEKDLIPKIKSNELDIIIKGFHVDIIFEISKTV